MVDPTDTVSSPSPFHAFPLDPRILQAIDALGFEEPTPIQEQAIGPLLEGRDVIGRARTGSGKTAAFGLPLLERLKDTGRGVRALILAPTRELALQVTEALRSYEGKLNVGMVTVYGGAPYGPQIQGLKAGARLVVGTPGRIIDHLDRKTLDLSAVDFVVIDEADEMLHMGFIDDVEKILAATPSTRQVALFSATMPPPIRKVASKHLKDPLVVQVEESSLTVDHIQQRWMRVPNHHKLEALARVLAGKPRGTTLVFAQTRVSCANMAEALSKEGVSVEALHGDLPQAARERVLQRMRDRRLEVVVATDVASRGLDVEHITHVINLDLPRNTEAYVHRIGRTGRAGRDGMAISFVTPAEFRRIHELERRLNVRIQELDVPSDAAIAMRQRDELFEDLRQAIPATPNHDDESIESVESIENFTPPKALGKLLELTGWTAEEAAAAALTLLAKERGVTLETNGARRLDDQPPWWSRPPARERRWGDRDDRGNTRSPRTSARDSAPNARPHARDTSPPNRGGGRGDERGDSTFAAADAVQLFMPIGSRNGLRPADVVGAFANQAGVSGRAIGRVTILDRKAFVGVTQEVADQLLAGDATVSLRGHEVKVTRSWSHAKTDEGRRGDRPLFEAKPRQPRPGKRERGARPRPDQVHPGGGRKGS